MAHFRAGQQSSRMDRLAQAVHRSDQLNRQTMTMIMQFVRSALHGRDKTTASAADDDPR